jgi:hypothetical protein
MAAPVLVSGPYFYCNTSLEGNQRSRINHALLKFDRPVNVASGAFTLSLDSAPDGITGNVTLVAVTHDQADGTCDVTLTFGGSLTQYGSLKDGNYTLSMNEAGVTARDDDIPTGAAGPWTFHRLFGDATGNRQVDAADMSLFQATYRSRVGQAAYRAYFDLDGNGIIDAGDNYQIMVRYKKHLEPDGTLTQLP